jgi:hypothetical protein
VPTWFAWLTVGAWAPLGVTVTATLDVASVVLPCLAATVSVPFPAAIPPVNVARTVSL